MASSVGAPATREGEFREDLNNILICPDCKEYPPNLVEEFSSGDMVCTSCGLVLGERIIDMRSEWRTFSNDDQGNDDPSRVGDGPNQLIDGDQLQTTIQYEGNRAAKNLAHLQNKVNNDKASKNLVEAYKTIQQYSDNMSLGGNVCLGAKYIFKLVDDQKIFKGKPQEAVIAGCLFIACRHNNVGRTFREIHKATKVSKKEIGRVFKVLEAFLRKHGGDDKLLNEAAMAQHYASKGSTSAVELCARYVSKLRLKDKMPVENLAKEIATASASVADLAGRSPLSVAAAAIYMATHLCYEPRTTKDIALVSGVSDGTVKTAYRFMYNVHEQLINVSWLPHGEKSLEKLPTT